MNGMRLCGAGFVMAAASVCLLGAARSDRSTENTAQGGVAGGGGDGTFEWTSAVSGDYFNQSRWTLVSGAGVPPPSDGDVAVFNEAGSYTVTIASGGTTHTDLLRVEAGTVRFRRSSAAIPATYSLTTNEADATFQNCVAIFGLSTFPLEVIVGDDTIIWNDAWVEVDFGSTFTTDSLALANQLGNSGFANMIVGINAASTVNVTGQTTIGIHGDGELELQNNSQVTFGSTSFIGTGPTSSGADGKIDVFSGADLLANASMTIGGGSATDTGTVYVRNPGSTLTLTGASSLTIGGPAGTGDGTALVDGNGVFTTGTGLTRVRTTGAVLVNQILDDGLFVVNGPLDIDGGSFTVWGEDALSLPNGATVEVRNGGELELVSPFTLNGGGAVNVTTGGRYYMATGGAIGDTTPGTVLVNGAGSSFDATASLELGKAGGDASVAFSNVATGTFTPSLALGLGNDSGSASITIETGAQVTSNVTSVVGMAAGETASITIDGLLSRLTVSAAQLSVGHPLAQGTAEIQLFDNGNLDTTSGMGGAGETFIHPHGLVYLRPTTTWHAASEVHVAGGELRVGGILDMQGSAFLELLSGSLTGGGLVQLINTTNKVVEAQAIIAPGAPEDIMGILKLKGGELHLRTSATLKIQLAGLVPEGSHDQLQMIDGSIDLRGTLELSLFGGFAPQPGDEFIVVVADGGVTGQFDSVTSPTPVDVLYTPTEVRVKVLASCLGDFVQSSSFAPPPDGVVDAADLAFLLGAWNAISGSPADMVSNGTFAPPPDGIVDAADLAYLLGQWGSCE